MGGKLGTIFARAGHEVVFEAITHLAFYSGWPDAMTAIMIAKELFSKEKDFRKINRNFISL